MRGTTYDGLVELLRAECRASTNASRGLENKEYLQQVLNRVYETLWDEYDWEFLQIKREEATVTLQAGQRYYSLPENVDVDTINKAWHNYGNVWIPIEYGIDYSHIGQMNPDLNVRADPVTNWDMRGDNEIEVWPVPASNGNKIAFVGKKKFVRMVNPTDVCELDDVMIVLFAATEILAAMGNKDAEIKSKLAVNRLNKIKGRTASKRRIIVGGGSAKANPYLGYPRIRVVYGR